MHAGHGAHEAPEGREEGGGQEGRGGREEGGGREGRGAQEDRGRRRDQRAEPVRPRRWLRILRWTAVLLAVLLVGTAGAGYAYYQHLNGNINKAQLNLGDSEAAVPEPTPNTAGQTPLNILLIGSDSRNTAQDLRLGGSKADVGRPPLADVQMLVHLSADRSNMSVVSLPRDTMIPIPRCTDPDRKQTYDALSLAMANESLGRGGPGCTVATWENLTHIHIDHFMMVDFSGVVAMADAIGGVPVCVKQNVWSHTSDGHGSGLRLRAGTHPVKGVQALQWLRTRYGFEDGTDIGRTHAQHMYMNSMVRQLRANARLDNPADMRALAETATKALTVDEGLGTVKKLYDLSGELQKVPTGRITMTTLPTVQWPQDRNRLVPRSGDADQLISMVRDDTPLDGHGTAPKPEQRSDDPAATDDGIAVRVRNGTGSDTLAATPQRASAVVQALRDKGFTRASLDTTPTTSAETTVLYPAPDLEGDAQTVARALGIPLSHVHESADATAITLTVGTDWRTGGTYPKTEAPTKAPDTAAVLNGEKDDACMDIQPGYTW
ncbi:LCP family protein [Streptomyces sp. NPDC048297]|uniref:LCP family protein n=1 Tax=Streptomyces sp. NPDC048297 TaxID=3365531 RepID=UPI00371FA68C